MTFMSPERLAPPRFDTKDSVPTQEADIYAFGLVIFQVCRQDRGYQPLTRVVQVLTGETPFRGVRMGELSLDVIQGVRPSKPENASAIGFSDSLWRFVQRCWDGDAKLRPKAARVVKHLNKAAADWNGLMPPCVQAENVAPDSEVQLSDSVQRCEFNVITLPYRSLNNITGETFHQSSSAAPESPTGSQPIHGLFTRPSTPSTHCTESVGGENVTCPEEERDSAVYREWEMFTSPRSYPLSNNADVASQSPRELVQSGVPARPLLFRALVERVRHRYRLSKEGMIARYPRRSREAVSVQHTVEMSWFQFPNQIASILSEKKFRNCVLNIVDEDVTQLVDYLDNVRLPIAFPDSSLV